METEQTSPAPAQTPAREADEWQNVGFHRPLGGLLYNVLFVIIAAGFGVVFAVWFIPNVIFPFPQGLGYQDTVTNLFGLVFTLLDLGVGASLSRYVAEESIRDPRHALKYVQFFIWYQMFTGLGQTTVISIWAIYLNMTGADHLVYLTWFVVIYSTVQYPGCLWVFNGALEAFQQYHKAKLVGFIQIQVFENILRITFILIGRWIGTQFPAIGEVMGATAGSIIGIYLREFCSAMLSGHYLAAVLRKIDPSLRVRDMFRVEFDRTIIKKSLSYGVRAMAPALIYPVANFFAILVITLYLDNYASIMGMVNLGIMLAQMITTFSITIGPTIGEAWLNGKKRLTAYYLASTYKWTFTMGGFMLGLLFGGATMLGIIAGSNFFLTAAIIQVAIFFKMCDMFQSLHDSIFTASGHAEYNIVLIAIEQSVRVFLLWALIVWFPSGWYSIVVSQGVGWGVKWLVGFLIFNAKYFRTKTISVWQTFVAPSIGAVVEAIYIQLLLTYLFPVVASAIGDVPAAIVGIVIGIFSGPFFVYFPVVTFFGGWDEGTLKVAERAAEMSGPSKFLVNLIVKISRKLTKISPLHNRFKIDDTGVAEEIKELMQLKSRRETIAAG
ncbi:MAG: hypothetical protein JW839_13255 [Candidatus Lokiarchaeota archaeon]|nr:hypothetical protein [Candidatus Lokiarchaeota archaeon]